MQYQFKVSASSRQVARLTNDAFEYLRFSASFPDFSVEILQFDLFAPKVVIKSTKGAALILFTGLVSERMLFNPLAHRAGVFIQTAAHFDESGGDYVARLLLLGEPG